jgi:LCP family protein required for cell wall assembly
MPSGDDRGESERPDYKVYRSRPGLLSRLRAPDLSSLRGSGKEKESAPKGPGGGRSAREPSAPRTAPGEKRRWPRWILFIVLGWIAVSFLAFAVSAQIQSMKLADGVEDELGMNPFPFVTGGTILVLGTDVRPSGLAATGLEDSDACIEQAGQGEQPSGGCSYRADTIMLIRVGGTSFRKLSIPRDSLADIPGLGPQKINGAYNAGGAKLMVETVESFLGLDVDHVAIVDFVGFRDLIDTLGGIEVGLDEPVCSEVSGGEGNGGFTLDLDAGTSTLDGDEALTLSRTRTSGDCDGDGVADSNINDLDRTGFQQAVISGIKGRLTDPLRLPYNFIKGPIIGWNAPKAFVSDMGFLTMPQLIFSAALGTDSDQEVLEPSGSSPAGNLIIPQEECQAAVEKLLGDPPPRDPACSPPA